MTLIPAPNNYDSGNISMTLVTPGNVRMTPLSGSIFTTLLLCHSRPCSTVTLITPLPVLCLSNCVHTYSPTLLPHHRNLFNAAFVSCWTELSETQQDGLIESLEQALTSQDIPEITQTLLNLAEFMEHCDKVRVHGTL